MTVQDIEIISGERVTFICPLAGGKSNDVKWHVLQSYLVRHKNGPLLSGARRVREVKESAC